MLTADAAVSVAAWQRWQGSQRAGAYWRGVPCQQFTSDLCRYAEVIWELRPGWVLETGTAAGGTALFLADALRAAGGGRVITIDVSPPAVEHPQVSPVRGDAAAPDVAGAALELAGPGRGLVLLDDDHSAVQVAAELELYAPAAAYLVVEDTIMEYLPGFGDGPHLALAGWLPAHPEFTPDPDPSPTQHPGGWLRRTG